MKRINLNRLHPRFTKLVKKYMQNNNLSQVELAKLVQLQRTHVNALLNGGRALTAYYLFKFIIKGVINVADIYDNKPQSEREKGFWETATEAENIALLRRIARMRKKGINVEAILDAVDPAEEKKEK